MAGVLAARWAMLRKLKAILQDLLVLVRAVVKLFASRTLEFDEVILGHRKAKFARILGYASIFVKC